MFPETEDNDKILQGAGVKRMYNWKKEKRDGRFSAETVLVKQELPNLFKLRIKEEDLLSILPLNMHRKCWPITIR